MSIRKGMSVWLVAAVIILCTLTAALCFVRSRAALAAEFDVMLAARAEAIQTLVHREASGKLAVLAVNNAADFSAGPHASYLQFWDSDGRTLLRSDSLAGANINLPPQSQQHFTYWDVTLPNGRAGRAVRVRYAPTVEPAVEGDAPATRPAASAGSDEITVALMQDVTSITRVERVLLESLGVATGLLCLGVLVVVPFVVKRGLASIHRLGEQARGMDAINLDSRFATEGVPMELRPICERLNDLLHRVETAFDRERRFTGNVAHELRTPISELRAMAEVSLKWPGDRRATEIAFQEVVDISVRMEKVVAALLALARGHAHKLRLTRRSVNLEAALGEVWMPLESTAAQRGVKAAFHFPGSAANVFTDSELLRTMLANLLANAAEYCSRDATIDCRLAIEAGRVTLAIANPTTTLNPADVPLLSEPFWRADSAGTNSAHAGLGLSLVACYAKSLGIDLSLSLTEGRLFCVRLQFPSGDVSSPGTAFSAEVALAAGN